MNADYEEKHVVDGDGDGGADNMMVLMLLRMFF
jgi:hypothetical protein